MKTRLYMQTLAVVILALMAFATQAANTTYYIYDESGHVIGEYDASGNPIQEHVYLGDRPVAVVQTGTVNGQQSSTLDYVTADQLNTPRDIMDSGQNVVWNWPSDPFGNGSPTGSMTYNLRFPGQYYDAETGHSYNYYRDYDPSVGRYIESDPFGLNGGLNSYTYSDNNTLNHSDPHGLCLEDACIGEGAAAMAAARAAAFVGSAIYAGYKLNQECQQRCDEFDARIQAKVDELIQRYSEALKDRLDLFNTRPGPGPRSWLGHKWWYEKVQGELRLLIGIAKALGCPINPEAEEWAETPFPD